MLQYIFAECPINLTSEASSMSNINYEDFTKIDLRVGTVVEAIPHPNADKLLLLQVNIGDMGVRQIVAGIKEHYKPEDLVGKQIVIVANLEPRVLRGEVSYGMILAAKDAAGLSMLTVDKVISLGSKVG